MAHGLKIGTPIREVVLWAIQYSLGMSQTILIFMVFSV